MQVVPYPGCCTAKIIMGFGQESNAGWNARPERTYNDLSMGLELDSLIKGASIGRAMGVVSVCLTSRQTMGDRVLKAMGFTCSGLKPKTQHRESTLQTYFINPREYIEGALGSDRNALIRALGGDPDNLPAPPKRLVKNLNPRAARKYRSHQDIARQFEALAGVQGINNNQGSLHIAQTHRNRARAMLDDERNFI